MIIVLVITQIASFGFHLIRLRSISTEDFSEIDGENVCILCNYLIVRNDTRAELER
jgi:hypothetical protein